MGAKSSAASAASTRHEPAGHGEVTDATIASIDARLRAVEELIKIFRLERYIYLSISILSFLILVAFSIVIFWTSKLEGQRSLFVLLFAAPSGAMLYTSAAFLKMWSQALQVLGGKGGQ